MTTLEHLTVEEIAALAEDLDQRPCDYVTAYGECNKQATYYAVFNVFCEHAEPVDLFCSDHVKAAVSSAADDWECIECGAMCVLLRVLPL